jgi:DNA-binding winged helix-turn-helix (wHTH) protein
MAPQLLRRGHVVGLSSKAFDVRAELVRQPGHLVRTDEPLAHVWPRFGERLKAMGLPRLPV